MKITEIDISVFEMPGLTPLCELEEQVRGTRRRWVRHYRKPDTEQRPCCGWPT